MKNKNDVGPFGSENPTQPQPPAPAPEPEPMAPAPAAPQPAPEPQPQSHIEPTDSNGTPATPQYKQ